MNKKLTIKQYADSNKLETVTRDNGQTYIVHNDQSLLARCQKLFKADFNAGTLYRDGKETGSVDKNGRCLVSVDGRTYHRHRIIYLMHYKQLPPKGFCIDHEDRDKLNDSISNLRAVSYKINSLNSDRCDRAYNEFMQNIAVNGGTQNFYN